MQQGTLLPSGPGEFGAATKRAALPGEVEAEYRILCEKLGDAI
jgi:hypothetical protein